MLHADMKYVQDLKSYLPFGKYTLVTDCELSITGTLMTHLRPWADFYFYFFE